MAKRFRESGKISCSCLRDSFRKKLVQLGLPVEEFGLHNLRAGERLPLPMPRFLTDCSRGMADGGWRMPRMAMLRMMLTTGLRSPDALACIFSNHLLCYPMYAVVALNSQPSMAQPSCGLSVCMCMLGCVWMLIVC